MSDDYEKLRQNYHAVHDSWKRRSPENFVRGNWSPEDDNLLREMWKTSSATLIANQVGRSRNAVIGRAFRLKLPPKGQPKTLARPKIMTEKKRYPYKPRPKVPKPVPLSAEGPVGGIHIFDLRAHHCRHAVSRDSGDGLVRFCGAPVNGDGPWCEFHHKLNTIPRGKHCNTSSERRPFVIVSGTRQMRSRITAST